MSMKPEPIEQFDPKTMKTRKSVSQTLVTDADTGAQVNIAPEGVVSGALHQMTSSQLTIEMFFQLRGVPVLHQAGMRAFTKVQSSTLQEWDRIFRAY